MNELLSALIIAVVQGLTEWLPVSSSGHLVLFSRLLGFDGGMMFDVALHFGTLMAVFVYFGGDIVDIVKDLLSLKFGSENGRLGLLILVATLPAVFFGLLLRGIFEEVFGNLGIVALGFGITGLVLLIASFSEVKRDGAHPPTLSSSGKKLSEERGKILSSRVIEVGQKRFGYFDGFLVGCAQVLALFPGISRSGSTISSGLLLGLNEKNAMKFSFLMSIPVIFGANVLVIGNNTLTSSLVWATLISFVVGLITIHVLYKWVLTSRKNLKWFAIYALGLGAGLGIWLGIS